MRLDHLLSKETSIFYTMCFILPVAWLRLRNQWYYIYHRFVLEQTPIGVLWGVSSAGRAPALHAGGQEFDPPTLHQRRKLLAHRRHWFINQCICYAKRQCQFKKCTLKTEQCKEKIIKLKDEIESNRKIANSKFNTK